MNNQKPRDFTKQCRILLRLSDNLLRLTESLWTVDKHEIDGVNYVKFSGSFQTELKSTNIHGRRQPQKSGVDTFEAPKAPRSTNYRGSGEVS